MESEQSARGLIRGVLSPPTASRKTGHAAASSGSASAADALARLDALHGRLGALRQPMTSRRTTSVSDAGAPVLSALSHRAAELRAELRVLGQSPPSAIRGAEAANAAGVTITVPNSAAPAASEPWWIGGGISSGGSAARSVRSAPSTPFVSNKALSQPSAEQRSRTRRESTSALAVVDTNGSHPRLLRDAPQRTPRRERSARASENESFVRDEMDALITSFVSSVSAPSVVTDESGGRRRPDTLNINGTLDAVAQSAAAAPLAHSPPQQLMTSYAASQRSAAGTQQRDVQLASLTTVVPSKRELVVTTAPTSTHVRDDYDVSAQLGVTMSAEPRDTGQQLDHVAQLLRRLDDSERRLCDIDRVLTTAAPRALPPQLPPLPTRRTTAVDDASRSESESASHGLLFVLPRSRRGSTLTVPNVYATHTGGTDSDSTSPDRALRRPSTTVSSFGTVHTHRSSSDCTQGYGVEGAWRAAGGGRQRTDDDDGLSLAASLNGSVPDSMRARGGYSAEQSRAPLRPTQSNAGTARRATHRPTSHVGNDRPLKRAALMAPTRRDSWGMLPRADCTLRRPWR